MNRPHPEHADHLRPQRRQRRRPWHRRDTPDHSATYSSRNEARCLPRTRCLPRARRCRAARLCRRWRREGWGSLSPIGTVQENRLALAQLQCRDCPSLMVHLRHTQRASPSVKHPGIVSPLGRGAPASVQVHRRWSGVYWTSDGPLWPGADNGNRPPRWHQDHGLCGRFRARITCTRLLHVTVRAWASRRHDPPSSTRPPPGRGRPPWWAAPFLGPAGAPGQVPAALSVAR